MLLNRLRDKVKTVDKRVMIGIVLIVVIGLGFIGLRMINPAKPDENGGNNGNGDIPDPGDSPG